MKFGYRLVIKPANGKSTRGVTLLGNSSRGYGTWPWFATSTIFRQTRIEYSWLHTYLNVCTPMKIHIYIYIYINIHTCRSLHLSVCLSVWLSVYLSMCVSVYASICLSICVWFYTHISIYIYISILYIYIYIYIIYLYIYMYISRMYVCMYVRTYVCMYVCKYKSVCICTCRLLPFFYILTFPSFRTCHPRERQSAASAARCTGHCLGLHRSCPGARWKRQEFSRVFHYEMGMNGRMCVRQCH